MRFLKHALSLCALTCTLSLPASAGFPWENYTLETPKAARDLAHLIELTPIRPENEPLTWRASPSGISCARVRLPASQLQDDMTLLTREIVDDPDSLHPTHSIILTLLARAAPSPDMDERRIFAQRPTILVSHGSMGHTELDNTLASWALHLTGPAGEDMGFHAVIPDYFTGRGIKDTLTDQLRVPNLSLLGDLRAVKMFMLRRLGVDNPHYCANSRGALATEMEGHQGIHELMRVPGARYPSGSRVLLHPLLLAWPEVPVQTPGIRFIAHGMNDHILPHPTSERYTQEHQDAGYDVALTLYPNATHAFMLSGDSAAMVWVGHKIRPHHQNWGLTRRLKKALGHLLKKCGKDNPLGRIHAYVGDPFHYRLPAAGAASTSGSAAAAPLAPIAEVAPPAPHISSKTGRPILDFHRVKKHMSDHIQPIMPDVYANPRAAAQFERDLKAFWRQVRMREGVLEDISAGNTRLQVTALSPTPEENRLEFWKNILRRRPLLQAVEDFDPTTLKHAPLPPVGSVPVLRLHDPYSRTMYFEDASLYYSGLDSLIFTGDPSPRPVTLIDPTIYVEVEDPLDPTELFLVTAVQYYAELQRAQERQRLLYADAAYDDEETEEEEDLDELSEARYGSGENEDDDTHSQSDLDDFEEEEEDDDVHSSANASRVSIPSSIASTMLSWAKTTVQSFFSSASSASSSASKSSSTAAYIGPRNFNEKRMGDSDEDSYSQEDGSSSDERLEGQDHASGSGSGWDSDSSSDER